VTPIIRCRLCSRLIATTHADHLRVCAIARRRGLTDPAEVEDRRKTLIRSPDAKRQAAAKAKTVPHTLRFLP
jgi:hypothetical protein